MKLDELALQTALQQIDRLDWGTDQLRLPASAVELPFQIHCFDTVTSTNTIAWDRVQQGATPGTVIIALSQQAGRGQWGRQWRSAPGGLYLSLVLMPDLAVEQAGSLTLLSAWGIGVSLQHCGLPVKIKWLNDLVVQGRKLGGILTETRLSQARIRQAVIGVGINWSNPVPAGAVNVKTVLAEQEQFLKQKPPAFAITSLETLAAVVLQGLRLGYGYWQQQGTPALVAAYEQHLVNLGEAVQTEAGKGKIIGVTISGQLRVCLDQDGREMQLPPGAIRLGYGN